VVALGFINPVSSTSSLRLCFKLSAEPWGLTIPNDNDSMFFPLLGPVVGFVGNILRSYGIFHATFYRLLSLRLAPSCLLVSR
jgi:hypothetical protein